MSVIADTGASGLYLKPGGPHEKGEPQGPPITVGLPDGSQLTSSRNAQLALTKLPAAARAAHVLPGLAHSLLLSIEKMCGAGCTTLFHQQHIYINKDRAALTKGT